MTAPVGSGGGGANLGTAYGKVRVDYETNGVAKAVSDVERLQSTLVSADHAMASSGKTANTAGAQINNFAAQTAKASDLVSKYTNELAKAQDRVEKMSKAGIKGQSLINAKNLAGTLSSDLANAKKQLSDWQKYVQSQQSTKLPAPRVDQSALRSAIEELKRGIKQGMGEAQDEADKGGEGLGSKFLDNLKSGGLKAGKVAGVAIVGGATAAVAAGVGAVGYTLTKGFQRLTSLDEAAAKLKALGYSVEQVKAVSNSALESVKGTAFGLDEAFSTAAAAIAAGIKPGQELTDYLKTVADNAALAGISMQEMGYIFGKVASTGKLQGDEMNIFMERNIDVVGNLAKELDKPRAAIKQMVTNGEIDFATFQRAMNANAGAAKTMGNSITGSFQNLKASISRIGAALLAPLFGNATGEASTFAKGIQWVTTQLGKLESWLGSHKAEMIDFWASIAKGAIGFGETVTHVVGSVLKDFGSLASAIGDVVGYMAGFDETISKIPGFGDNTQEAKSLRDLQKGLKSFGDTVEGWGKSAEGSVGPWEDARTAVDKWATGAKNSLNATASLGDAEDGTADKTISLTDALDQLQLKGDAVSKQIEGTNEQFAELLKTLKDKKASEDLIATVTKLREQFTNGGRQAKAFADAVRDFGDKSLTASDRGDKLITSLQNLGLLPGGDTLRDYNKALEDMTKWDNGLIDLTQKLGDELVNIDGTFNTSMKNGATLDEQIKNTAKSMAALVASGDATPEEAYGRTSDALKILLSDAGISGPMQDKIIQKYLPTPQAMAEALKGNTGKALEAAGMDPMQVKTELNLITQADDILKNIVGPDGRLHVPTVLDPNAPSAGGAPAPVQGGASGSTGPVPDTPPGPPPPPPGVQHGRMPAPDAASKYQAPPDTEWWKVQVGMVGRNFYWPLPKDQQSGLAKDRPFQQQSLTDVEQEAIADPARVEAAWAQMDEVTKVKLRDAKAQAEEQGKNLAEAYAEGVFSGEEYLRDAIKKLAGVAADGLGHSPAKYGPLAGKGWSYYRGQSFTEDWAAGIQSRSDVAQNAVGGTAQTAVLGFGDSVEQMVKDFQEMSDFGKHLLDFTNQITNIAFGVASLANDFSGGKLFPKTYTKDLAAKSPTGSRMVPWQPGGGGPSAGIPSLPAELSGKSVLRDTGSVKSGAASQTTAALVSQLFPQITEIGGSRDNNTVKNTHDTGTSIDIAIPNYDTAEGKALGDRINEFVRANHEALGVEYSIWQNTWKDFAGNVSTVAGHMNHIDVHFKKDFIPNLQSFSDTLGLAATQTGSATGAVASATASTPGGGTPAPGANANVPQRPNGPAPAGQTWDYSTGKWIPVADAFKGPTGGGTPSVTSATTGPAGGSKQDIADYIISKAMSLGYTRQQGEYFATQAFGESAFDPLANGGNQDGTGNVRGIFQFTPGTWGNRPGSMTNAKDNIDQYFALAAERGLSPESFTDPTQLGTQVSIGGPYHPSNTGHRARAEAGVAPYLAGFQPSPGLPGSNAVPVSNPFLDQIATNTLGLPDSIGKIAETDPLLAQGVAGARGQLKLSDTDAQASLQHIDGLLSDANEQAKLGDQTAKQQASVYEGIRSQLMQANNLKEGPTALESAQNLASGVSGVASSIFESFDAGLKAISATKNIGDILVRGVANTEDVYNLVENFQAYIELGAKIAQTVSSIANLAGSFAGGDPTGMASKVTGAISSISSMVSEALSAVNTAIDIGQEAWKIGSKYLGRFLTQWFGFPGANDIKYLLDTTTGQLNVYSSENPQMKHVFNTLPRAMGKDYPTRTPPINQLYVFQGPGQDPRDTMDDAMFTIRSSGVGAFGYGSSTDQGF